LDKADRWRQYYEKHREKRLAYFKEYHAKHAERRRACMRERYHANKDEYNRLRRERGNDRAYYHNVRKYRDYLRKEAQNLVLTDKVNTT
jgi:hypothetical protein